MRLCFALIFSAGFSLTLQALDDTSPDSPADLEATALEAAVVNSTPESTVPTRLRPEVRQQFQGPLILDDEVPKASLEDFVSTPTRVVETDFETPYRVDSISGQDLIERSVRSLPEAFEQTPGVLVQKTALGQGSPFIRGFTAYHNLLLIDGIRLNNSVFRSGPNQYWNTIDTRGLSGIELVKSQGSVLYGSDAVGGTVQAQTRRPVYAAQGHHTGGRSFSRYAGGKQLHSAERILGERSGRVWPPPWRHLQGIR